MSKMSRMHLLMLSNFGRADGGRETWAYNFIPLLLKLDPQTHLDVFGLRLASDDNTHELSDAVEGAARKRLTSTFWDLKWPRIPRFFSMFVEHRKHAKQLDAPETILGVGGLFELLMMRYASRSPKSKKILWLRSVFFDEKADRLPRFLLPLARRVEVALLENVDLLLANGDDIAAFYGKSGLKVEVIKNGVDTARWSMMPPTLSGCVRVAFVGRLSAVKGINEFLQAVELMKNEIDEGKFEFHVVGHGPEEKRVRSLADADLLTFHGSVDNRALPALLQSFDVCVALTLHSRSLGGGGTSNALMEQMAAGRVVVAWDNPIFAQLLSDRSSYLVEQGSIDGLRHAFLEILSDPASAQRRSKECVAIAASYSLDAQVQRFLELVHSMDESSQ